MENPMKKLENPSINYQHSAKSGLFHGKKWKILVSTINIQLDLVYFMEHSIKQWKILVSTIKIQLVDLFFFHGKSHEKNGKS